MSMGPNSMNDQPQAATQPHAVPTKGNLRALLQESNVTQSVGPLDGPPVALSRSRSSTLASIDMDFDLDFVNHACDTWGLMAPLSNSAQAPPPQHQMPKAFGPLGVMPGGPGPLRAPAPLPSPEFINSTMTVSGKPAKTRKKSRCGTTESLSHHDTSPSTTVSAVAMPGASSSVQSRTPSLSSSQGSGGSKFVKGIMNPISNPISIGGACTVAPAPAGLGCVTTTGAGCVAHTPPTGSSYEASHFGKRMRSGSISGRLRSASELEDRGLIDRQQRNMLKDLIISSNDAELQAALDHYEEGDTSRLEAMIRSGALFQRHSQSDLDLLDDLDLDFLTFNDMVGGIDGPTPPVAGDGMMNGTSDAVPIARVDMPQLVRSKSTPIPVNNKSENYISQNQEECFNGSHHDIQRDTTAPLPTPPVIAAETSLVPDDGIGDLEFDGDYSGAVVDNDDLPGGSFSSLPVIGNQSVQSKDSGDVTVPQTSDTSAIPHNSAIPSSFEAQRSRADSLQLSALLDDNQSAVEIGHWMDGLNKNSRATAIQGAILNETPGQSVILHNAADQIVVLDKDKNVDGSQLINAGENREAPKSNRGRRKSANAIEREAVAAEKRRERILKRQQREQEKREKKERRERETREKREREQREREQRKKEKAEAAAAHKAKHEKKKEALKAKGLSKAAKCKHEEVGEGEGFKRETPSGLGLPRTMSDPNLCVRTDDDGLMQVDRPEGWVGAYSPDSRKIRIERFLEKRNHRVWAKTVKYDVRKSFADSRLRVKGRFVKKEDEQLMRDLMSLT